MYLAWSKAATAAAPPRIAVSVGAVAKPPAIAAAPGVALSTTCGDATIGRSDVTASAGIASWMSSGSEIS